MNVQIEKITNGYVVTIDGKKTFCDVAEAICGLTSEAVLAECARPEKGGGDNAKQAMDASLAAALAQLQQQQLPPTTLRRGIPVMKRDSSYT